MTPPLSPYKELVGLLFPDGRNSRPLMQTALEEIKRLRWELQKDLPGLRARLDVVTSDRDFYRSQYDEASEKLRTATKTLELERLVSKSIREANNRLIESEAKLREQLASHKSWMSPPKFHIGQVCIHMPTSVGCRAFAVKLDQAQFQASNACWRYTDTMGRSWDEDCLRALTPDEMGVLHDKTQQI